MSQKPRSNINKNTLADRIKPRNRSSSFTKTKKPSTVIPITSSTPYIYSSTKNQPAPQYIPAPAPTLSSQIKQVQTIKPSLTVPSNNQQKSLLNIVIQSFGWGVGSSAGRNILDNWFGNKQEAEIQKKNQNLTTTETLTNEEIFKKYNDCVERKLGDCEFILEMN